MTEKLIAELYHETQKLAWRAFVLAHGDSGEHTGVPQAPADQLPKSEVCIELEDLEIQLLKIRKLIRQSFAEFEC